MAKKCKDTCVRKTSIGGQALIEGIMMRGPRVTAMAVRDPEGNIVLEKWNNKAPTKSKLKKLPLVRGVFGFIDSMTTGYKSLMRSAEIYGLEEAEEELKKEKEAKKAAKKAAKAEKRGKAQVSEPVREEQSAPKTDAEAKTEVKAEDKKKDEKKKESSGFGIAVTVISILFAAVIFIGLFMMLPSALYGWCSPILPEAVTGNVILNSFAKSAFEGLLRVVILVSYMLVVSLMKDIRRTFMYHGAEHKTIFCYEHGKELTVENVRKEGRFHPRCGTSFLILMVIVSIVVSFFIDPLLVLITQNPEILEGKVYFFVRTGIKLVLIPVIMGIGYELIKLAGRHDNLVTRIISAPGVWLQHITVLEPTDDMIECAILAFKEVIPESEKVKEEAELNSETVEAAVPEETVEENENKEEN